MMSTNKFIYGIAVSICCITLASCSKDVPPNERVVVEESPVKKVVSESTASKTATQSHHKHADDLNSATVNGMGG